MGEYVTKQGIYPSAILYGATTESPAGTKGKSRLEVEVDVIDNLVMQEAPGADVWESVKVGIPFRKRGQKEPGWKERDLKYEGKEIRGYYARDLVDSHEGRFDNVNVRL